ncbi:hypothetical protein [Ruicaihuangia caeni]|uniref:Glycosyltransferase family 2 protein n=1 Tax=Ruicaihuangia caeni TaxID=3042517 RepID=A0AAW6TBL3_9MICO|nr:hypothetical protein [Klugiella sp. YN-L-19]MDI2099400.1 hypothetical protein [Klugiella sp. YN-L-19]
MTVTDSTGPAVQPRSLVIQQVLYRNDADGLIRAAEALANSVKWAREDGVIGDWTLALGDCSPQPALTGSEVDGIRSHVEQAGGTLTVEFFDENLGHGGGHNRLAKSTTGDLLLVLNPDSMLGADSVGALARTVAGDIALADGRQIPFEHPKEYDPRSFDTSWASGACSMLQRQAFDQVGGFDHETFFMYCDDVDLSWRLRLAGHRVVHEPAARVFHDKRLSTAGDMQASDTERYYSAEAAVLLPFKYSRPDIARSILKQFEAEGSDVARRVVAEVARREREGTMPAPLDAEHRIATFVDGNYSPNRF